MGHHHHISAPQWQGSHSNNEVTNSTSQQPARHATPSTHSKKTQQHFTNVWRLISSYRNQKGEKLPYEEWSRSWGTCRDPSWSNQALGGRRAACSRGVGVVLSWADLNIGTIPATLCCCFCLKKNNNNKHKYRLIHLLNGHGREKSHAVLPKSLCKGEGDDTTGWGVTQLDKSTAVGPAREKEKTMTTADKQNNRDLLWWVMHS